MNIRTRKPEAGNKFYNNGNNGGWSWCINGKPTDRGCNVLSNCVGYACGRFNEIIGSMKYKTLCCNAENFIERAKQAGLQVVDYPTIGGIMCWQKGATLSGNDGAGHVGICEKILEFGSNGYASKVYTSESGWGGSAFWNSTRSNSNGRWGMSSGYRFRGCIVNPAIGLAGSYQEKPKPEPKPEPKPQPSQGLKFSKGDVVIISGRLYGDSYGGNPGITVNGKITTITRVNPGAPYPYNTVGDLGWMAESSIQKYSETKGRTHKVVRGDTVSGIALKYYGHTTRADWDKIKNANGLNDNYLIIVGQTLVIPD